MMVAGVFTTACVLPCCSQSARHARRCVNGPHWSGWCSCSASRARRCDSLRHGCWRGSAARPSSRAQLPPAVQCQP